jgi:cyclophilin family peptidyl-prolyl cis-trans isomerase
MAQLQRAQQSRRRRTRTYPIIAVVILLAIGLAIVTGTSGGSKKKASTTTTIAKTTTTVVANTTTTLKPPPSAPAVTTGTTIKGATPCPSFTGTNAHVTTFAQAPPLCITAGKTYTGTFETNLGNVVVQFDTTKTPNTANNFIVLSLYHYFDETAMFRTDTSIDIIQGGSPHTQNANDSGPGYTIKDEGSGYTYAAGDLVMARGNTANSASAQYFFCAGSACSELNSQGTYVVFAHVTSGLPLLEHILSLNVNENNGLGGAPSQLVVVKTITISAS